MNRELLEETGYTVKNVRPAGVGPLQIGWPAMAEALLSEKQRERCQQFQGDQSHFSSGGVAGPPVEAVDPSGFKDARFRRPWSLQKLFRARTKGVAASTSHSCLVQPSRCNRERETKRRGRKAKVQGADCNDHSEENHLRQGDSVP
jgi:hypothetical protein